jgi:hypothetical protein
VRGGYGVVVELEFCFLYYDRWWVQVLLCVLHSVCLLHFSSASPRAAQRQGTRCKLALLALLRPCCWERGLHVPVWQRWAYFKRIYTTSRCSKYVLSIPPHYRSTVGLLAVTGSTKMSALARLVPQCSSLLTRSAGSGSLVWCMATRGMAAGVNRREPREHTPRWKQAHLKKKKRQREDAVERGEGAKGTHYPVMLTETIDALLEGMTPNAPDGGQSAACRLLSAACLLPAACCLLPAVCCLLSVACCLLPAGCCLLSFFLLSVDGGHRCLYFLFLVLPMLAPSRVSHSFSLFCCVHSAGVTTHTLHTHTHTRRHTPTHKSTRARIPVCTNTHTRTHTHTHTHTHTRTYTHTRTHTHTHTRTFTHSGRLVHRRYIRARWAL